MEASAAATGRRVIDEAFIGEMTQSLTGDYKKKVESDLRAYQGKTLETALNEHSAKLQ